LNNTGNQFGQFALKYWIKSVMTRSKAIETGNMYAEAESFVDKLSKPGFIIWNIIHKFLVFGRPLQPVAAWSADTWRS
jgi:hypothetical protein